MRIAIDATPVMKAERTGIARYVRNLVRSLAEVAPDDDFDLCYRLSRWSRRKYRMTPPSPRFRERWVQGVLHPCVDVVHGTDGRAPRFRGARTVSTVHDVFSLDTDEFASDRFREKKRRRYSEIADRADRIVTPSEWTARRFRSHHPLPEDRFVVTRLGVEDRFRPEAGDRSAEVRARHGIEGPYVVFVGEISVRKNVRGMLDAVAGMAQDSPRLVLAGRPLHGHEDIREDLLRRGLEGRVVLTGFFPDGDLPALFAGAECLLLPSLMEGFGLPVIEAMACGTPAVISDRGALPEVAGGAALVVDPEDPESIRAGLSRILDDTELREDLVRKGLRRVEEFRWPKVAERTMDAYREALL